MPTLRRLIDSRHRVVAVVSQPDRPRGRGHQLAPTPTKDVALAHGIHVLQPERLRDEGFLEEARGAGAGSRRRRGLRQAAARRAAADSAARHDQRARVAAAALARRRAGAPRGDRRRRGDRRDDHARREGARRGGDVRDRRAADRSGRDQRRGRARPRGDGGGASARRRGSIAAGRATETPQDETKVTLRAKIAKAEGAIDWRCRPRGSTISFAACSPGRWSRRAWRGQRVLAAPIVRRPSETPDRPGAIVRGRRRPARGRRRRRPCAADCWRSSPKDGASMSAREFLAGRRLVPGMRARHGMIAPARVAAYEVLRAVEQRPRGSAARARARRAKPAGRARPRAGRRDRHRHAALAGGIRSRHRAVHRRGRSRSSIPRCSTSCA